MKALKERKISLQQLSWRELEDVVAGVLQEQGFEIHVVRNTPQGGRDMLARGDVAASGESLLFAVEVTHRKVVNRPLLERTLWQNRYYPALMFVTSGRFTAGAIAEKNLPENRFRLILRDGTALGDMIATALSNQAL